MIVGLYMRDPWLAHELTEVVYMVSNIRLRDYKVH